MRLFTFITVVLISLAINSCGNEVTQEVILPGIYQTDIYFPLLKSKRIALVANKTSKFKSVHLIDSLISAQIDVTIIFAPEHGFEMDYEAGAAVKSESYNKESLQIISLYGKNYKPQKKDLEHIDIIIFDLQDVGVRFFTYLSTLHYVMEVCAELNKSLILLDRPNPNGFYIDGPVLDTAFSSFVGMHPVPIVYGMTIGEYAKMINGEGWLKDSLVCDLRVVPCVAYTHKSKYALPVSPSPNLPDTLSVELYPTLALFEGSPVSIGRGTEFPFQVVGHPDYPVREYTFTPKSIPGKSENPKFKDQICFGLDFRNDSTLMLIGKNKVDLEFVIKVWNDLGAKKDFFTSYFNLLAGNDKLCQQIYHGMTAKEIRKNWETDLDNFKKIRDKYLIYP